MNNYLYKYEINIGDFTFFAYDEVKADTRANAIVCILSQYLYNEKKDIVDMLIHKYGENPDLNIVIKERFNYNDDYIFTLHFISVIDFTLDNIINNIYPLTTHIFSN